MEGSPSGISPRAVERRLIETRLISDVHSLRIWRISLQKVHMTLHCKCEKGREGESIEVIRKVAQEMGIEEVTPCVTPREEGEEPDLFCIVGCKKDD